MTCECSLVSGKHAFVWGTCIGRLGLRSHRLVAVVQTQPVMPVAEACCCAVQAREVNAKLRRELQLEQQRREIAVGALVGSA